MNTTTNNASVFSNSEPVADVIDRPFRPSGLLALLLGALSVTAIFAQTLMLIPVLAILVGLFALRPATNAKPVGRLPAMLGILLAVFCLSWSWTFFQNREAELSQHAGQFAKHWLEIVGRGEVEVAYELTKLPDQRQMAGVNLEDFYSMKNPKAFEALDAFSSQGPLLQVQAAGEQADWQFEGVRDVLRVDQQELIYSIFSDRNGIGPKVEVILSRVPPELLREIEILAPDEPARAEWIIFGIQNADPQANQPQNAFGPR